MPANWRRIPISELCSAIVDCVNKTAPTVDGPTPFRMIRTTNVKGGFVDLSEVRYVDEATFRVWTRRQVPRRGDVILTREAPLGEVGLLRDDEGIFLGQRLVSYRADPSKADSRFLLYALRGPDLQGQILGLGAGATVAHMRVPDAERLSVNAPDVQTQRRIGSILGAYDDLIEVNRRRITVLEEMARRLFDEWFVHFRFPGHDGSLPRSPTAVPAGWQQTTFGALVDEVRDTLDPAEIDTTTAYVGLEHIPRRSTTLDAWGAAEDVTSTKLRFRRGDILFGKIRPYFHKVVWAPFDGICSSDAIVWRPRSGEVAGLALAVASSDAFVAHSVQTSNGTKMPRANPSVLSRYPLALPPAKLLSQFDATVMAGVELAASLQAANRRLAASRDLLLPRLISGDLPVTAAERELEAFA